MPDKRGCEDLWLLRHCTCSETRLHVLSNGTRPMVPMVQDVVPATHLQQRATHPDPSQQPHTASSHSESAPQPKLEGSSGACINSDPQVGSTDANAQGPSCSDQQRTHHQEVVKQEEQQLPQHHQAPRMSNHQAHVERPKRTPTIIPSPDEFERGQPGCGKLVHDGSGKHE
eukprot:417705-Pelagomonas_calceolata.AAC.1